MLNIPQIAHNALTSTSKTPRWWILALLQAVCFSIISPIFLRPQLLLSWHASWFFAGIITLTVVTVWFWLDIDARSSGKLRQKTFSLFFHSCVTAFSIILLSSLFVIFARWIYNSWIFLALISSLVAATAVLAMLFAVLTEQKFFKAWRLAFDTWTKKASLAAAVAFLLILGHAASYAFVNGFWNDSKAEAGVELLSHSATIWILLAVLAAASAFILALINCFLVFLFLEIIRRKKDPEHAEAQMVKASVFEPNL